MTSNTQLLRNSWKADIARAERIARDLPDGDQLADNLYASWWTELRSTSTPAAATASNPWASLVAPLQAAHADTREYEDGWYVVAVAPTGQTLVARTDPSEQRWSQPVDVINLDRPCVPAQPGEAVAVVRRCDRVDPTSGYWFTWSPASSIEGHALVRVYFNVDPLGALAVVGAFTAAISRDVSFQLKFPSNPDGHLRPDSLVVYLRRDQWNAVRDAIASAISASTPHRRADRPPLTLPLAPGVAIAEDRDPKVSLGTLHCLRMAESVRAVPRGRDGRRSVDAVTAAAVAGGLDLSRPWAEPGATPRSYTL